MSESAVKVAVHRGFKALTLRIGQGGAREHRPPIDLLSAKLEPVGQVHFGRTLLVAMLAGAAAFADVGEGGPSSRTFRAVAFGT